METAQGPSIQRPPISAVIISRNTARTIGSCLEALQQVADEIIVLDSFSDDGTVEICQRMGARVVSQEWLGYGPTKNAGHALARHDWILSIDADEVLSPELIQTLRHWQPRPGEVYALDRITSFNGRWIRHCGWYPDWKVRLFNRCHVHWNDEPVHETLHIPPGFRIVRLKGKLFHHSFASEEDFRLRLEKYARLGAKALYDKGRQPSKALQVLATTARFLRTFVWKAGFLDGRAGWTISIQTARMVWLRYELLRKMWDRGGGHPNYLRDT